MRHGCRSLTQFEILPQPPLQRAPDNPWPQWPKVYVLDYGQAEAAAVFGSDPRRYSITTKRFAGDEQGNVKEAHTVEVEWVSRERQPARHARGAGDGEGSLVQLVLQDGFRPEDAVSGQLGVERDDRSNAKA
jgi:glutamate synthase (NADPH/NADH) small chain